MWEHRTLETWDPGNAGAWNIGPSNIDKLSVKSGGFLKSGFYPLGTMNSETFYNNPSNSWDNSLRTKGMVQLTNTAIPKVMLLAWLKVQEGRYYVFYKTYVLLFILALSEIS